MARRKVVARIALVGPIVVTVVLWPRFTMHARQFVVTHTGLGFVRQ